MLKVKPMSLCDFAIDCLLDPVDVIDDLVAPLLLHDVDCPLKLGIDDPDEQKSLFLEQRYGDVFDGLITEAGVLNSDSS